MNKLFPISIILLFVSIILAISLICISAFKEPIITDIDRGIVIKVVEATSGFANASDEYVIVETKSARLKAYSDVLLVGDSAIVYEKSHYTCYFARLLK